MKQIIVGVLMFTFIGISCKKESTGAGNKNNCLITTIEKNSLPIAQLSYDGRKLIQAVLSANNKISLVHDGNFVTAVNESNGTWIHETKYELNSNGLVSNSLRIYNQAGTDWVKTVHYYTGTRLDSSLTSAADGSSSKMVYNWDAGNPVKKTLFVDGVELYSFEYVYYTDKPYQPADNQWEMATSGVESVRPKNLVKSATKRYPYTSLFELTNYLYETDDSGKIIAIRASDALGNTTIYSYTYECN